MTEPTAGEAAAGRPDLGSRVARGTAWVAFGRWGTLLVTWPITIAMARILEPSDYGYLTLLNVFTRFGRVVAEGGLANIVVMGPSLSDEQYRRLHGWSLLLFLSVGAVIAALAIPIENFYQSPGARNVLWALVVSFIADGLTVIPVARMRRAIRFKELALADGAKALAEGATSLTLAWNGMGYWSLIFGFLTGTAVSTALVMKAAGMRPRWPRLAGLQETLRNAGHILVGSVTNFLATSSDAWAGGSVVGAAALGGYGYMASLSRAPVEKLAGIITYGVGSILGNSEGDRERIGRTVLRVSGITSILMMPVLVGIMLVAEDFVGAVLGEKWLPYTSALRLLCLYSLLMSITTAINQAVISVGRSSLLASNGIIILLILPVAFYFSGRQFGATGLALAWLVPFPILVARSVAVVLRESGITLRELALTFLRPSAAVCVMSVAVLAAGATPPFVSLSPWARLFALPAVGAVSYGISIVLLARHDIEWLVRRIR